MEGVGEPPDRTRATALRLESTPVSELLTFLHLLAGSGSSSASDELEEPGSLSASARKQASERGLLWKGSLEVSPCRLGT